ncbi:testis-expressed protein 47-like [Pseudophryne corroboree]|uniref:testis-expressed protein 47-like n=1 Tax=Pseudophryne corroboree TaxID=495146 RepID=UPI0030819373
MATNRRSPSTTGLPHASALTAVLEAKNMRPMIHRLFYVAKRSPEQAYCGKITDHYERLFHKQIKSNLGESISGLLLIYPSCVIHMVESSSEILQGIIQDLVEIQNQGANSLLQDTRILVLSHNIPSRLLPQWYFHEVRLPVLYLSDMASEESLEPVVEDCLTVMLKLGVCVSQMLQPGSKCPGGHLTDLAPELLVREDIINFLTQSDMLLEPRAFLALYNKPINAPFESDEVWPTPQHQFL